MQKAKRNSKKMKKTVVKEENAEKSTGIRRVDVVSLGNAAKGGTFGSQTLGGLYLILNSYKRDPNAICCVIFGQFVGNHCRNHLRYAGARYA